VHPEIPGFKIIKMLGEGAMARVFLAMDESLDRKVALKVMNQSLAIDPSFRDRFLAEAKDTAKFIHTGIVSIYSTGIHGNDYYLVLEYLESGTLKDRQRARLQFAKESEQKTELLFSAQESLVLLSQMADALNYAHSKNVIHRDIKPANIMFRSDGKAVLTDFGIAKSVADNRELTQTGFAVGTPAYMSPEQKLGAADIDGRSDLYSLGVVFYELLTGRKPFRTTSGNYADLRKQLEAEAPELPGEIAYLQPLLYKLLARDPADRFSTAGELSNAIKEFTGTSSSFLSDATVIQKSIGPRPEAERAGKKKVFILGGALAAAIVIIGIIVVMNFSGETRAPIEEPLDEKTRQRINQLMVSVRDHVEDEDFITNCPSCAWYRYDDIEQLPGGKQRGVEGKEDIKEKVLDQIRNSIKAEEYNDALGNIEIAEVFYQNDESVIAELAGLRAQAGQ
jgi:serine/threonine protein kinase